MPTNLLRGDAIDIAKVYRLTPATPEPGDKFGVTINSKTVWFTAASTLVADVIDGLAAAIAGSAIAEFTELTAVGVDSDSDGESDYLEITAATAGMEVELTTQTVDAGGFTVSITTQTTGDAGRNEIQSISLPAATSGGTFTLSFSGQTTSAIDFDADAATVQTALEALSNLASGDVSVSGSAGEWSVEFTGSYALSNVPLLSGDGSSLTGAISLDIQTHVDGSASNPRILSFTIPDNVFPVIKLGLGTQTVSAYSPSVSRRQCGVLIPLRDVCGRLAHQFRGEERLRFLGDLSDFARPGCRTD